jgi:CxxC motif-containing protein (DUF1111 family)
VPGGSAQLYANFHLAAAGPPPNQSKIPQVPSLVVPAYRAMELPGDKFSLERARVRIPPFTLNGEVIVRQRNAVPVFGVGLFEFVTNETILSNSDPDDADGDSISGRFNTSFGAVGRLGLKAQANNVEVFTRPPLFTQMGITSRPVLGARGTVSLALAALQAVTDPNRPTLDDDGVRDPEIKRRDLIDLISFTRFLAPPAPLEFNDEAKRGEVLFEAIGCVKCHLPTLPSSRGTIAPYSDLLLHEMGPGLADGIAFGTPQASSISANTDHLEFRTQPLWGVSLHGPFLHDGRAETLDEAIRAHGGEAAGIRQLYVGLSAAEQDDIIAFLEHL